MTIGGGVTGLLNSLRHHLLVEGHESLGGGHIVMLPKLLLDLLL